MADARLVAVLRGDASGAESRPSCSPSDPVLWAASCARTRPRQPATHPPVPHALSANLHLTFCSSCETGEMAQRPRHGHGLVVLDAHDGPAAIKLYNIRDS